MLFSSCPFGLWKFNLTRLYRFVKHNNMLSKEKISIANKMSSNFYILFDLFFSVCFIGHPEASGGVI